MKHPIALLPALVTATLIAVAPSTAAAQKVLAPHEAAKVVTVRDLKATPSEVSGVIVNNTPHMIRDVEIAIEYHWIWANEFKPGRADPGRSFVVKLNKELRPGESVPFRFVPDPPLEKRTDGQYLPEAVVTGFTTVIPATTTR
jgi:hypothetical protein